MDQDPLEKLARLREEADGFAQRMEAAARAPSKATGSDPSGTVTVTVTADGQILNLGLDRSWRTHVGADGLAAAVTAAVSAAAAASARQWADAVMRQQTCPNPTPRPFMLVDSPAYQLDELATAQMTPSAGRAALEELLLMAEAVERGIDELSEHLTAGSQHRYVGRSRARHVEVVVSGDGAVEDVRHDQRWLARADDPSVARETTEALREAQSLAAQSAAVNLIVDGRLQDIQRLGQDPMELARRLRLRED